MPEIKLLHKKTLFYTLVFINPALLTFCFAFKGLFLSVFISYELGFFASLLIILSSFLAYKKKITQLIKARQSSTNQPSHTASLHIFIKKTPKLSKNIKFRPLNDDLALNLSQKTLIFTCFFAGVKLLSYALFVLLFLIIVRKNMLDIFALFSGVSSLLGGFFVFLFLQRRKR